MLVARSINATCATDIELVVPDIVSAAGGVTAKHPKGAVLADFKPAFARVRDDSAVEQGVMRASLFGTLLYPPAHDVVAGCFDFGRVSNHVFSKQRSRFGPHGVAGVGDEELGSLFRRAAAS